MITDFIQNKLPAIFITVLAVGIIILSACSRFTIIAACSRFTIIAARSRFTIRKTPEINFPSGKNILLKVALLYPIAIFFACGLLSSSIYFMSRDGQILGLLWQNAGPAENLEISVAGRISGHVKNVNGASFFSLSTDQLILKDLTTGNERVINATDEVFVRIRTNDSLFLKRDDFISFNCSIYSNDGFMSLTANQDDVIKTDSGSAGQKIYNIRSRFYECIRNTFYDSLDYKAASLCEAIILGNTNNISEKIITDFRKSGIYHLVAISGLHITFFIYLATVFFNFILRPSGAGWKGQRILRLLSFIFIILTLFMYNFIVGQKASALRATVMSVFVLTANLLERQYNKKIILSISFIIILALNPEFFYDWGFWLSFTSMAGILYLNPVITDLFKFITKSVQKSGSRIFGSFPDADDPDSAYKRSKRRMRGENYFISSIITTVSVSIFIFPVIIFLFRELPVFSIPANLMASPVFYILLAILLTASFLSLLWPPLGGFILKPAGPIIEVLLKIARIYKISDFNVISLSNLKSYQMIIYYFTLAIVFVALSMWLDRKKARDHKSSMLC